LRVDVASTAFDGHVTDQTLTGSGSAAPRHAPAIMRVSGRVADVDDDVKWTRRNYGVVPSSLAQSLAECTPYELPA